MAITLTNESKNSLAITNENKTSAGDTFDSDPLRKFSDDGSFAVPGIVIQKESKNSLTITNESKN